MKGLAARYLKRMIQNVSWCCNVNTVLNGRNRSSKSILCKEIVQPLLSKYRIIKFYLLPIIGILNILCVRKTVDFRLGLFIRFLLKKMYF